MVVAVAWLPMMTMEKTAAASDYREQQAWNAAEAGYKRAVAALSNKNADWRWLTPEEYIQDSDSANFVHLSIDGNKVDQDEIWYAVGIIENNADIASDYTLKMMLCIRSLQLVPVRAFVKLFVKTILRVISAVLAVVTAAVRKHWNYQVWYRLTVL